MLIAGSRVAISANTGVPMNLWIQDGKISLLRIASSESSRIDGEGFLVLPGLINAHDHLELNLFPRLGRGPYPNATAWAKDIYRPLEPPVKQHLAVPKAIRLTWGAIKNVLSGVTTVGHHNALDPVFSHREFPIRVVKHFGWAHSLKFSSDWEKRFRMTPQEHPFVIHAAEGTDESARHEIHILAEAGALSPSTVLVHAVAAERTEVSLLESSGTSIVWCPSSNHFTLGQSLARTVLESRVPIALGSDSAMTGQGDLLDELRFGQRFVTADRLYSMVTTEAARMLKLPGGYGCITHGGPADFVLMKDNGLTPAEALLKQYPELVMVDGRVVVASAEFVRARKIGAMASLRPIQMQGRGRYLCPTHVRSLLPMTQNMLGEVPRLAGKAIAA
jgi:cytosine/adenosine deaminase-related metal-dependent hydrolase